MNIKVEYLTEPTADGMTALVRRETQMEGLMVRSMSKRLVRTYRSESEARTEAERRGARDIPPQ